MTLPGSVEEEVPHAVQSLHSWFNGHTPLPLPWPTTIAVLPLPLPSTSPCPPFPRPATTWPLPLPLPPVGGLVDELEEDELEDDLELGRAHHTISIANETCETWNLGTKHVKHLISRAGSNKCARSDKSLHKQHTGNYNINLRTCFAIYWQLQLNILWQASCNNKSLARIQVQR